MMRLAGSESGRSRIGSSDAGGHWFGMTSATASPNYGPSLRSDEYAAHAATSVAVEPIIERVPKKALVMF